ncbi:MAG: hypothetical protein SFV51_12340 [Bryobacteraceae bacterium]|nr:hypothetical protein [Bryobacteraceae bacterium]
MQYPKCILFTVMAAAASLPSAPAQTQTYTNSSLKGTYVFTETGLPSAAGAIAAAGVLTADGNGGVSGTITQRLPGQFAASRGATGTYQINQDGTGNLTLSATAPGSEDDVVTRRYQVVFSKAGLTGVSADQGLFGVVGMTVQTESTGVTLAGLKGRYAFSETGAVNHTSTHLAIGTIELDGSGAVTGSVEFRTLGRSVVSRRLTGVYTVSGAGLGEMTLQYSEPSAEEGETETTQFRFAIIVAGQDLVGVRLDNGVNAVSRLARQ